jgi:hypothetical protein
MALLKARQQQNKALRDLKRGRNLAQVPASFFEKKCICKMKQQVGELPAVPRGV